uniref:Uncharacterized protein n=1 Tax=Rhizophora mucronata TaxID=61149 RepID=A0A2P2PUI4_RHIMU
MTFHISLYRTKQERERPRNEMIGK